MSVGIRDLKSKLSEYVARAAGGEEIVVTDRNRPVARLVPYIGASDIDRGIEGVGSRRRAGHSSATSSGPAAWSPATHLWAW